MGHNHIPLDLVKPSLLSKQGLVNINILFSLSCWHDFGWLFITLNTDNLQDLFLLLFIFTSRFACFVTTNKIKLQSDLCFSPHFPMKRTAWKLKTNLTYPTNILTVKFKMTDWNRQTDPRVWGKQTIVGSELMFGIRVASYLS